MRASFKKILYIIILFLTACSPAWQKHVFYRDYGLRSRYICLQSGRELLKQVFLCQCIDIIYQGCGSRPKDISMSVYFDIIPYNSVEVFPLIHKYAQEFVESIEPSIIEDHQGNRPLLLECISAYNEKELDSFIRSLDCYFDYNPK